MMGPLPRLAAAFSILSSMMLAAPTAGAMTFSLVPVQLQVCAPNCPLVIVASGEIALDSDDVFYRFITAQALRNKVASTIVISSPGGNLLGSLKLGVMMRQLGFSMMVGQVRGDSFVTARCYSACAYTLAGGKRRIVPDGSEVGVHRAWTRSTGQRDILGGGALTIEPQLPPDRHAALVGRYLKMMGVSDQLVAIADATPSSDIRVLSPAELSRLRLATPQARERRRRN